MIEGLIEGLHMFVCNTTQFSHRIKMICQEEKRLAAFPSIRSLLSLENLNRQHAVLCFAY